MPGRRRNEADLQRIPQSRAAGSGVEKAVSKHNPHPDVVNNPSKSLGGESGTGT